MPRFQVPRRTSQRLRSAARRRVPRSVLRPLGRAKRAVTSRRNPPGDPFVGRCLGELPRQATVVLLTEDADSAATRTWTEAAAPHRTVVATGPLAQRHDQLSRCGPVDLIVDLTDAGEHEQAAVWRKLFFHLKPGGRYVVPAGPSARDDDENSDSLTGVLLEIGRAVHTPGDLPAGLRRRRRLVEATDSVELGRDGTVVRKRGTHLLKLRYDTPSAVLTEREPHLSVSQVEVRPAGRLPVRCEVRHHGGEPQPQVPSVLDHPELQLRHYEGRVAVMRNRLVHTERSILPESFRHHLVGHLRNRRVTSAGDDHEFGVLPEGYLPWGHLTGSYYHLDSQNSGHFGHLMGEDLSRLWGWPRAKALDPSLKVLFRTRWEVPEEPVLPQRLFRAFGIAAEDIVWTSHPVTVDSLWGATPMLQDKQPFYIHPDIAETWDRLAAALVDPDLTTPKRVFVSRRPTYRKGNRTCRNAEAVESLFVEQGFEVVYPELLDLVEQATVFRRAEVVAGFAGSGMYNLVFARPDPTVIVLGQDEYEARTEELFCAVKGGELHYFWNPPDRHSDRRHPRRGHYSSWSFDVARHGPALAALLGGRSADR